MQFSTGDSDLVPTWVFDDIPGATTTGYAIFYVALAYWSAAAGTVQYFSEPVVFHQGKTVAMTNILDLYWEDSSLKANKAINYYVNGILYGITQSTVTLFDYDLCPVVEGSA